MKDYYNSEAMNMQNEKMEEMKELKMKNGLVKSVSSLYQVCVKSVLPRNQRPSKSVLTPYQLRINALFTYNFSRRMATVLMLVVMTAMGSGALGQTIEIGTGTSTNYLPLPGWWGWQYDVYLYTPTAAAELNEDCTITSIAFNSTTSYTGGGMTVWIKDVEANYSLAAATTFATYTSGATQVYNNNSITSVQGWNTFNFSSSFSHQGGKALLVAVRGVGCSTSGGCPRSCYYTSADNTWWYKHQDSNDPGTNVSGTLSGSRVNVRLGADINMSNSLTKTIECGKTYNFYDSGGPTGNYSTSQNYTATFTSEGDITINFSQFVTENSSGCYNWDYIEIYDGNTSGTLLVIGQTGCSSRSLMLNHDYTATSGTMTVVWHSDGTTVAAGWAATITATGCPEPIVNCEGFEGGSMPAGWSSSGPGTWSVGTGDYTTTTGAHTGSYNAKINHTTNGNQTYLITPSMDFSSAANVTLSFWYVNRSWAGDIDELTVCYRVNNGVWQQLYNTGSQHAGWTQHEIDLPPAALAANCQIGFMMTDRYGYGVGIDDVCFTYPAPACTPRTASISGCPSSGEYLVMGNTLQLTGSTSAGGGTVTWSSSNTSVATVSNTGLVTPVAPGNVTITYSRAADDTYCSASTTCDITVRQCSAANTIILDGDKSKEIVCGQTYCFYDSGGPDGDYANYEDYTATFESMGEITITFTEFSSEGSSWDYITIYDGDELAGTVLLNRHGGGSLPSPTSFTATSGTMTVKWKSDSSNGDAGWSATITAANCCTTPRTLTINGCPSSDVLSGSTTNLTATVSPAGVGTVEWTSNNTTVAEVSNTGVVTAKAPGTVIITASIPRNGVWCNASATCTINVICAPNSATFALSTASGSLEEGQSIDLSELLTNGTGRTVTWTSSATGTATVNASGVVTGVAAGGPVTITARVAQWTEGGITYCEKTATYTVNVTAINCTGGSWNMTSNNVTKTIECGKTYCFYDSGGDGQYGANENYTWHFEPANPHAIVHIKFLKYSVEGGSYDYMTIAGTTTNGTYTTMTAGQEFVASVENGTIDITWRSDNSVYYDGWRAIITAEGCCTPRSGDFEFCITSVNATTSTSDFIISFTNTLSPAGAVSYTNSNPSVASYEQSSGTVHPLANGSTTITATVAADAPDGYCEYTSQLQVNVGTPGGGAEECNTYGNENTYDCDGLSMATLYRYSWVEMIYTSNEVGVTSDGCSIKSIAFKVDGATSGMSEPQTTTIYIGTTTKSQFDSDYDFVSPGGNAMQNSYTGTWTLHDGWNVFNLNTPFAYTDHTKNLIIGMLCITQDDWCNDYIYYTESINRLIYGVSDDNVPTPTNMATFAANDYENYVSRSDYRPDIKICTGCEFTPTEFPSVSISPSTTQIICKTGDVADVINDITVTAEGGSVSISPSDKGLSYSTLTHKITGTPNFAGSQVFTVTVTDANDCLKRQMTFTITVNELNATIQISNP